MGKYYHGNASRIPEPKISDFLIDDVPVPAIQLDYHDDGFLSTLKNQSDLKTRVLILTNNQSSEYVSQGPITWWFESPRGNYTVTYKLPEKFGYIKDIFISRLQQLRESFQRCLAESLSVLNQIIADANYLNKALLDSIPESSKQDFLSLFSLTEKTLPNYKFSAWNSLKPLKNNLKI